MSTGPEIPWIELPENTEIGAKLIVDCTDRLLGGQQVHKISRMATGGWLGEIVNKGECAEFTYVGDGRWNKRFIVPLLTCALEALGVESAQ